MSEDVAKMSAMKNSFHTLRKLKIVTVTSAGCTSGSMICQKVFAGEHPSIAAASS